MIRTLFLLLSLCTAHALVAQSGLERLMEGNQRYVNDQITCPQRTQERRQALTAKQEPFAIIVGCSDSRVSPEIVFDQGVGDLFVVRVAGNVIGNVELDSIEYGAIYLHSSVILVLGHENCAAVDAVIHGVTKDIESVATLIEPAVREQRAKKASNLLEASIKANALNMREFLLKSPVIQRLVSEKKLEVYAGYYDLQSGAVEVLNPPASTQE